MKTFLTASWQDIVMVNYAVPEAVLQRYLPFGLELDLFEGSAYVSLVGFRFLRSKIFNCPIPFYGSFDEVNLRFYVKRKDGNEYKRGCVFISEIVPYRIVATLANWLYREHYSVSRMRYECRIEQQKKLHYGWQKNGVAYAINAVFENTKQSMIPGSLEEFIYEHYYGYTNAGLQETWEYELNHPRWEINPTVSFAIDCNFEKMYGKDFALLDHQRPVAVFNAIGSEVSIGWHIHKFKHEAGKKRIPSR